MVPWICRSDPLAGLVWAGLTLSPTFSHELRRNYGSRGRSVNNATRRKFEKLLEVLYRDRRAPDHPISDGPTVAIAGARLRRASSGARRRIGWRQPGWATELQRSTCSPLSNRRSPEKTQ